MCCLEWSHVPSPSSSNSPIGWKPPAPKAWPGGPVGGTVVASATAGRTCIARPPTSKPFNLATAFFASSASRKLQEPRASD